MGKQKYTAKEKKVSRMTRNGLVEENLATKEIRKVTNSDQELSYKQKDVEQAFITSEKKKNSHKKAEKKQFSEKVQEGNDDGDTKKLLELLLDTWIDEVEDQLKENTVYQGMLEKISKYEEQVQTMGLSKEKRKTIDKYVTEVSERWILYAESLYQAGMQKILELLNL